MPIIIAPKDKELLIKKVILEEKLKKHMENLGVVVGGTIKVVSQDKDSVIVIVKNVRLALDKNIATKILVA